MKLWAALLMMGKGSSIFSYPDTSLKNYFTGKQTNKLLKCVEKQSLSLDYFNFRLINLKDLVIALKTDGTLRRGDHKGTKSYVLAIRIWQ